MTRCIHCEELEEKVRQLEVELYGHTWEPPEEMGLTPCHRAIVQALVAANGRVLSRDFLISATRRTGRAYKDFPDPKMMDVTICKLRIRLRQYGLSIRTVYARGYALPAESRERLLNWTAQEAVAA